MIPTALMQFFTANSWKLIGGALIVAGIAIYIGILRHEAHSARTEAAQAQVALGTCQGNEITLRAAIDQQNAELDAEKRRADGAEAGWQAAQAELRRKDADLANLHGVLSSTPKGSCPSPKWASDVWDKLK